MIVGRSMIVGCSMMMGLSMIVFEMAWRAVDMGWELGAKTSEGRIARGEEDGGKVCDE